MIGFTLLVTSLATTSANGQSGEKRGGVILAEPEVTESSGLAVSHRNRERFWTHNDSGGKRRIFAFDREGRPTGRSQLTRIEAGDWEDIASFIHQEKARLLIADCGDNKAQRKSIALHLIDEPDPDATTETIQVQTLRLTYPNGPRDCEAVAVDPRRKQIVLISKSRFPAAGVHVVPLPGRDEVSDSSELLVAKRVTTLPLPMITAMDIDPRTGDLWLVSYFQAFQFRCIDREEPLSRQLGRVPRAFELPRWKQIESVAVDASQSIWVTSEGVPAIMGRVTIPEPNSP